ncbi:hypothetical protein [Halobaculum sp. EA56]|uniref:hypothetical protein n=1 Tax=Halobaculum sp. EA56 TaxID=3421648 RepID=UPI003EBBA492
MSGRLTRRNALTLTGTALLGGLSGCSGLDPESGESVIPDQSGGSVWNLLKFLPDDYYSNGSSSSAFSLLSPAGALRKQKGLGPRMSSSILNGSVGERGWINEEDVERQVMWNSGDGWGYAFETDYSKDEILERYRSSVLSERPSGSYNGYELIDRSSSWHAIGDGFVLKVPSRARADIESWLDVSTESTKDEMDPRIDAALQELDPRYRFTVSTTDGEGQIFADSGIHEQGIFRAVTPYPDDLGYRLTTALFTEKPERLAAWAREQRAVWFDRLVHHEPEVRTTDSLVVLDETGTVDHFSGYT